MMSTQLFQMPMPLISWQMESLCDVRCSVSDFLLKLFQMPMLFSEQ